MFFIRCRIPEFCERYKIDCGLYDLKCKRIFPRSVKEKTYICTFKELNIVLFGRKKEKLVYLKYWRK